MASDLALQNCGWKCLHDSLGRLSLHRHLLAEHQSSASLRGLLLTGLDHAQPWKNELARLLHLLCANLRQAVQHLGNVGFLHLSAKRPPLVMAF
eukprot:Skav231530  [mRNA]  locus=scaffold84:690280:690577:+ [translate_table: standard]